MRRSPTHGDRHSTAARFRHRGGVELGEEPRAALQRKVRSERRARRGSDALRIIGAYGGALLEDVHLNGDLVGNMTIAYRYSLDAAAFVSDEYEVLQRKWVTLAELSEPEPSQVDRRSAARRCPVTDQPSRLRDEAPGLACLDVRVGL